MYIYIYDMCLIYMYIHTHTYVYIHISTAYEQYCQEGMWLFYLQAVLSQNAHVSNGLHDHVGLHVISFMIQSLLMNTGMQYECHVSTILT